MDIEAIKITQAELSMILPGDLIKVYGEETLYLVVKKSYFEIRKTWHFYVGDSYWTESSVEAFYKKVSSLTDARVEYVKYEVVD